MTMESSLVYTREDGSQGFVHDSYREYFAARYIASKISGGKINLGTFYDSYLTTKTESVFGTRYIPNNSQIRIISFLVGLLKGSNRSELTAKIAKTDWVR